MKKKSEKPADANAEEKIREAARKLFMQKGYAAVKTRDIAAEAGINLALLNYYFRSKEKLFELIMMESLQQFMKSVTMLFQDEKLSMDEKIDLMVSNYIDMLLENPDLPLFILSELRSNPERLAMRMDEGTAAARASLMRQLGHMLNKKKGGPIHPFHIVANMIGMTVFPFAAAPMLTQLLKVDREQFKALMIERKKLIPVWLKAMITA